MTQGTPTLNAHEVDIIQQIATHDPAVVVPLARAAILSAAPGRVTVHAVPLPLTSVPSAPLMPMASSPANVTPTEYSFELPLWKSASVSTGGTFGRKITPLLREIRHWLKLSTAWAWMQAIQLAVRLNPLHIAKLNPPRHYDGSPFITPLPEPCHALIYFAPFCWAYADDPRIPLVVTDDIRVANRIYLYPALALFGSTKWRGNLDSRFSTSLVGARSLDMRGRKVYVFWDPHRPCSPCTENARRSLLAHFQMQGAQVYLVTLTSDDGPMSALEFEKSGSIVHDILYELPY